MMIMESVTTLATSGAAAVILTPLAKKGADLMERLLGPCVDEAGLAISDQVRAWRLRNQVSILTRAEQMCKQSNTPFTNATKSYLAPLIEAGGNTDDPDIQELFARLLCSSLSSESCRHPRFVDTIRQMSGTDAKLLSHAAKYAEEITKPEDIAESVLGFHTDVLYSLGVFILCFQECDSQQQIKKENGGARISVGGVFVKISPYGRELCRALNIIK